MVHDRVVSYYNARILEDLKNGKNVIIVSHHNPLRALIKYLENIPEEKVSDLALGTSELYLYQFDDKGRIVSKEIRKGNARYH